MTIALPDNIVQINTFHLLLKFAPLTVVNGVLSVLNVEDLAQPVHGPLHAINYLYSKDFCQHISESKYKMTNLTIF